jgi:D-alanyl-D-alanine carboxypeptidase/D-alanyl-D-alanine-endopeptidase (penicillin-binding protein 4)
MKQVVAFLLALVFALPAWAVPAKATKIPTNTRVTAKKTAAPTKKPACKPSATTRETPPAVIANEAPKPDADDPERDRVLHLQEALDAIIHGKVFGRLRVGMRVEDLASGRLLYSRRGSALMDPASNQKVLATTAALLRLGSTFRYRTEITGAHPDGDGRVHGDLVIRGSGDPSLRPRHLDAMAESLVAQGVTAVTGGILGDPRRLGSDESAPGGRSPLRVGSTAIEVHVRPGDRVGDRPVVSVRPASDAFAIVNQAETRAKGKGHVEVSLERAGNRIRIVVAGKIAMARGEVVIHRAAPSDPLYVAILLRHALIQAGIEVRSSAGIYTGDGRARIASNPSLDGALVALGPPFSDSPPQLGAGEVSSPPELLTLHESESLPVLLRRVNKDSDNEWAERVLETVGAEVYGGAPTTAKGVRVLREALADLGIPAAAFISDNGSGLGHHNRVSPAGMAELLRRLYFDQRVGPEMLQSLSVGGVDGTTRNRFRGSPAAHRVRAKTGTLTGVSCLSGYVGDGPDVLVFSILVEGHRKRAVTSVRAAQVGAVNAMMRFARRAADAPPDEESVPGTDLETGDELEEIEGAVPDSSGSAPAAKAGSDDIRSDDAM